MKVWIKPDKCLIFVGFSELHGGAFKNDQNDQKIESYKRTWICFLAQKLFFSDLADLADFLAGSLLFRPNSAILQQIYQI